MKTLLALAILATTASAFTACRSSSSKFTSADEAAVRAVFDSSVARVKRGDWTSWANEYADNGVLHPSNGKALKGRAAILAWGQGFPPLEQFSMSDVQVSGEGNLAYGTSAMAIKLKDLPADTSKQLVVFRRSPAGRWEVVAVSVNSDLPPVPAAPVVAAKK